MKRTFQGGGVAITMDADEWKDLVAVLQEVADECDDFPPDYAQVLLESLEVRPSTLPVDEPPADAREPGG